MPVGSALNDATVFLQLIAIKRQKFVRRIIRFILDRHHFHTEEAGRNIYIRALAVSVFLGFLACAGVHGQARVANVRSLVDVNASDRSLNIDLTVLSIAVIFHIHAACDEAQPRYEGDRNQKLCSIVQNFGNEHEDLLVPLRLVDRFPTRAAPRWESSPEDGRESESRQTMPSPHSPPTLPNWKMRTCNSEFPENPSPNTDFPS